MTLNSNDVPQGNSAAERTVYELQYEFCENSKKQWTSNIEWLEERLQALPPELETYRPKIFGELVKFDMVRRRTSGAPILIEEYDRRFPDLKNVVESTAIDVMRDPGGRRGMNVDEYRIGELIGQGGTADVYEATNAVGKKVAIKFMKADDKKKRENFLLLFENEVKISKNILPRSIFVQTYGYGKHLNDPYLAMEFVDGKDLYNYVDNKEQPLDWREATRIVAKIAKGLPAIHDRNIAHRDLTPRNVMLDKQENVYVLDLAFAGFFGLRQNANDSLDGILGGTEKFSPSEALQGLAALDARSDLYYLGGIYLYLLTKTTTSDWFYPYFEEVPQNSLPDFLQKKGFRLPGRVVKVLSRLLEPNRENRYQNAVDAGKDLDAILKPRLTIARAVVLTLTAVLIVAFGLACFEYGGIDQARLDAAIKLEAQGDFTKAFEKINLVNPEKLADCQRFDYHMLQARRLVANDEFVDAFSAINTAFDTLKRLSETERLRVGKFERRVWEVKPTSTDANVAEVRQEAISSFRESSANVAAFFEKRSDANNAPEKQTRLMESTVLCWLVDACRAYGTDDDLKDLSDCLEPLHSSFCAQKARGDLLRERTKRNGGGEKQEDASAAIEAYQMAATSPNATNDEKIAALCGTILTCDDVGRLTSGSKVCEELLLIDSKSPFALRYRGKFALRNASAGSPQSVEPLEKAKILKDLSDAANGTFTADVSKEESGEIWMEIALATLSLGEVSQEDCETCVNAVANALDVNAGQYFYRINDVEWNVFEIRQRANEKKRDLLDSADENSTLDRQIWEDAQKAFNSKLGKISKVSSSNDTTNAQDDDLQYM